MQIADGQGNHEIVGLVDIPIQIADGIGHHEVVGLFDVPMQMAEGQGRQGVSFYDSFDFVLLNINCSLN